MSMNAKILVEHGPNSRPALFQRPREIIVAHQLDEVAPALAALDAGRARGLWAAGFITYEAGFAFEPRLRDLPCGNGPLLAFGLFDRPEPADDLLADAHEQGQRTQISAPAPLITPDAYADAFARLQSYIAAGDCYQVNLTFPLSARLTAGTPLGLYGALRRTGAVSHGAFVDLGVGPVLVSRSPELFLRTDAGGRIHARPMKGTRPRDADPARDAALAAELAANPKDRAENLMIVDLLRNDISRLAQVGSVRVPELFAVEHYATVHQMVSAIEGQLVDPPNLSSLMAALFPCGSITGAPKIRAMQIIAELEPHARGAYCGAIGWMAPDGASDFSVAIRTLAVTDGDIRLNVGGGVVADSTADGEWEEALWKARFVNAAKERG